MGLKFIMALLVVTSIMAPLQAGLWNNIISYFQKNEASPPKINLLIVHDKPGVVLEVKGKYKLFNPHTDEHISTRFIGKRKFIQAVQDGIKWGEEFPGIHQLLIVPDERNSTTIVDGIEYRGRIFIYDIGGSISIVNQIFIEDYLSSILAKQSKNTFSDEVLAAIAITARTSAYYANEHPKSQYWSVDGQQPMYQGFAVINQGSPIERAVKNTQYMIMSHPALSGKDSVVPFLAQWKQADQAALPGYTLSKITLEEAETMAKNGDHAAQILAKAFPGIKIELMHYISEPASK